ncbi:zinc ribbon domain-containing protein [Paratractidigestivibacter sp.]|uniref:zinc ribbon domain-containing protein n=1 Tax=Paratractidigestivibacter sp. TaxID=2847316 RepID=UPI003AB160BE
MYCMKCGHELEDGARFCTECGAQQDVLSTEKSRQQSSAPRRPSVVQVVAVVAAAFAVMAVGAFAFICLSSTLPLQSQSTQSQDAAGAGTTTGSATGSGSAAGSGDPAQKPISDRGDALDAAQGDVTVASGELTYANDRYGYKVVLPADYELVDASDNGDGATFRDSSTGVEVRVWGSANALGETLDSVLESYTSAHDVSYKAMGGTWVVASWVEGGNEYYAKQYVGDDNINGIQFSYPQSSSDAGSAVIEAHIDEFVPGDL